MSARAKQKACHVIFGPDLETSRRLKCDGNHTFKIFSENPLNRLVFQI